MNQKTGSAKDLRAELDLLDTEMEKTALEISTLKDHYEQLRVMRDRVEKTCLRQMQKEANGK